MFLKVSSHHYESVHVDYSDELFVNEPTSVSIHDPGDNVANHTERQTGIIPFCEKGVDDPKTASVVVQAEDTERRGFRFKCKQFDDELGERLILFYSPRAHSSLYNMLTQAPFSAS